MDNIKIQEENSIAEVLEYLIESDELEPASKGIIKKVLADGRESLSSKQEYVFSRYVEKGYLHPNCDHCGMPLPPSEILPALMEVDGLCSWCRCSKAKYY